MKKPRIYVVWVEAEDGQPRFRRTWYGFNDVTGTHAIEAHLSKGEAMERYESVIRCRLIVSTRPEPKRKTKRGKP